MLKTKLYEKNFNLRIAMHRDVLHIAGTFANGTVIRRCSIDIEVITGANHQVSRWRNALKSIDY